MMIAESMLSKHPVLRLTVALFSSLSYFRPIFIVFKFKLVLSLLVRAIFTAIYFICSLFEVERNRNANYLHLICVKCTKKQ